MNRYMNFWHLLNKRQYPISINGEYPFEPGTRQLTFVFHNGEVTLTFEWESEVIGGMKSPNPNLIPNDPDTVICIYLAVTSIVSYDQGGNEKPIKVTFAINTEFAKWIQSTEYLHCDEFAL